MAASSRAVPAFVRLAAHPLRWRLLTELAGGDLRVRELVARTDQPQSLVSYHLRLLRDGGLVTTTRSTFDGRDSYNHLDLDRCAQALAGTGAALHPALRPTPAAVCRPVGPVAVLFVCTGNSARSPIAAALLRRHTGGQLEAASAGSSPKPHLHPHTVRVLREEYGIDIADQRPRHLNTLTGRRFDHLITLCDKAREARCELLGHAHRVHWSIPDPAGAGGAGKAGYPAFVRAAADIDTRIRYLLPVLANAQRQEVQP
jgi:ArsR family transcriptional regulator, arsenate/arsenite/antimonite-responsive transcriptional repressor / arsenate reductase (thioredoxin)